LERGRNILHSERTNYYAAMATYLSSQLLFQQQQQNYKDDAVRLLSGSSSDSVLVYETSAPRVHHINSSMNLKSTDSTDSAIGSEASTPNDTTRDTYREVAGAQQTLSNAVQQSTRVWGTANINAPGAQHLPASPVKPHNVCCCQCCDRITVPRAD
jgi:hypothetical protein